MGALFLKLLNMSIGAVWLILVVVILRLVLKKAPRWISCALWGLVAFRLVCPISLESGLSLIPSGEVLSLPAMDGESLQVHTGFGILDSTINEYLGNHYYEGSALSSGSSHTVLTLLGVLWLLGTAALTLYSFISFLRLKKRVSTSIPLGENMWICDCITTPFILGVTKPRIYLPSDMTKEQRVHVLIHEKSHLKRQDHLWKPLGFLLLTVYWFNPVIWLAYVLLCRDIEIACDERVIKDYSMDDRKAYSKALLSLSAPRRMVSACPLAFGEIGVKKRIRSVLNFKKPAFWMIIVAVIACIGAAVCFLTNPVSKSEPEGSVTLRATVLEISDGYLLVEPVEGSPELSSTNRISLMIQNMPPSPEPQVGDVVEIQYDGAIMESYPAQLGQVYGIRVVEDKGAMMYDRIPMVMVDGKLFYDTGETIITKCGTYDGEITSSVDGSEIPVKNNQSNFGKGFGYLYSPGDDRVVIHMNEKWCVFEYRSDTEN